MGIKILKSFFIFLFLLGWMKGENSLSEHTGSPLLMPLKPQSLSRVKARGEMLRLKELQILKKAKGVDKPSLLKAPLTGTRKAIVLLVDFNDNIGTREPSSFSSMLFSQGSYPTGSLRDYYKEVSYSQLEVTGDVSIKWYRVSQNYSYYTNGQSGLGSYPKNSQKLVEEVLNLADNDIDFSNYDVDGDGYVDILFVVHAGSGAEANEGNPDMIWSHKWNISSEMTKDGIKIFEYAMVPEDGTIGVFCHELGHIFGLPDLYDTEYDSKGIGDWSLMASGCWGGPSNDGTRPVHLDAWSRIQLGWVDPTTPTTNQLSASIPNIEENQKIYKLWKDGVVGPEYFLVENRQQVLFDNYLPGNGLLIYHIDDNQPNNDDQTHYKVALEQADGLFHLENNINEGDSGDPFPGRSGNIKFAFATTPSSKTYSGADSKVAVENISASSNNMTADLLVDTTPHTVNVSYTNLAPAKVNQGENNVGMLKLTLSMDAGSATITQIKMKREGSGSDSDIIQAKLYSDSDGDGKFNPSIDSLLGEETFTSSFVEFKNLNYEVSSNKSKNIFIVLDFSPTAVYDKTISLNLEDNSFIMVANPDLISSDGFPINSSTVTIDDVIFPQSQVNALPVWTTSTSFSVSWGGEDNTNGSGIKSYNIQVREGKTGIWTNWLTNTTLTSNNFSGEDGKTYYFRSSATDNASNIEEYPSGDGDAWTTVDASPPTSSVKLLSSTQNSLTFTVEWSGEDNTSGIDYYDIQVKVGKEGTWTDWKIKTKDTQSLFTGEENNTYYFQSRAVDLAGNIESFPGGDGDTYTLVDTPPHPPELLEAVADNFNVYLKWQKNTESDILGYNIYRSTETQSSSEPAPASFTKKLNEEIITDNSWIDADISWDSSYRKYWYKITAMDKNLKESEKSNAVGITDTTSPEIMEVVVNDITDNSAVISWKTDEPSTSLVEYGLDTNYGMQIIDENLTTSHNITLKDLTAEAEYHFRIKSTDLRGNIATSFDYQFTTTAIIKPIISNISVTPEVETAEISWQTNINADSLVEFGLNNNYGKKVYCENLVVTHKVQLSGLSPNTTYHFRVSSSSVPGDENYQTTSSDKTFTTKSPPDTQPPEITHTPITSAPVNQDILISAKITDNVKVDRAYLYYRKKGEVEFNFRTMVKGENGLYQAIIPKEEVVEPQIEYYLWASDGVNTTTLPSDPSFYLIQIISKPEKTLNINKVYPVPNPAKDKVKIIYKTSKDLSSVKLEIYSLSGKLLTTVYDSTPADGEITYNIPSSVANGVYFYRLIITASDKTLTRTGKIVIIR